jgi:hypothetical protein
MEVHTHSHTARKKWTHYLWEFLMLFLAVFCGFLAENKREHLVEHQREKQFMRSLTEDLETDTAELNRTIVKADSIGLYSDSVLYFLFSYKPGSEVPVRLADLFGTAGRRLTLINTDRTSAQLKNSGSMRLIRDKEVTDNILRYWKQIDETNISLERYIIYRDAGRSILFKLWVIPEIYLRVSPADTVRQLRVIDNDPKKWDELANLTAIGGSIVRGVLSKNLEKQRAMAESLITLIKKEYHLE